MHRAAVLADVTVVSDHDDVWIFERAQRSVNIGHHRVGDERQVEVAALDEAEQLGVVLGLGQLDLDLRPCTCELAQDTWRDSHPDALVTPHAQCPGRALGQRAQVGLDAR